ncbi:ABC transporter ATP-binding protein [Methanobacterium oryzae]|uniref:ABC transporter ATP-binding protein n=1 Tax=Methanobacterium oryzae TaxID=69540 RepID=UPI003D210EFB
MNNALLEFKEVWKTYGNEQTKMNALKGINLSLKKNSFNLILGPSGSGKTTLLNIASLLDTPTKGKVILGDKHTSNLSKTERSKIRMNEIGIIYQRANLFPYLNVLENVMLPMISKDKNKALELLKSMGINETSQFPEKLSAEDQQKVALSRAMINDPSLILADEPTGELDTDSTNVIMKLIKDIGQRCTVLIVSNNTDLFEYADNLFSLKEGIIIKK